MQQTIEFKTNVNVTGISFETNAPVVLPQETIREIEAYLVGNQLTQLVLAPDRALGVQINNRPIWGF